VGRRGELRCGGGAFFVVVVAAGGVGAGAVLVVGCVADVVDCVAGVVDCVVVVDRGEVVVERAPPEPADRCEPVPPWCVLCLPFSVPVGDVDFVGFLPPVWFVWPDVGLAGVRNWMVAVPPEPPVTSVTWTVTS